MIVTLSPGQHVQIRFSGEGIPSDGEISIGFSGTMITVFADLPDRQGRQGVIYQQFFGPECPQCEE